MAYNEALAYAKDRKQFGKAIIEFPAVYDMLAIMKAKLDAGRSLLYATSRYVDVYKILEDIERERKAVGDKLTPEERNECKTFSKLADAFTPVAKGMTSEYANQNTYDGIQVHGGSGFMLEYACQRLYRDARILSIYEGTTQLQTVAAGRYITNGFYGTVIADMLQTGQAPASVGTEDWCAAEYLPLKEKCAKMAEKYNRLLLTLTLRRMTSSRTSLSVTSMRWLLISSCHSSSSAMQAGLQSSSMSLLRFTTAMQHQRLSVITAS
jgi:hypothetical protein